MDTQVIRLCLYLHAPVEVVWHALTDPDTTARYWDGTRLESSWQPGEPLLYRRHGEVTDVHTLVDVQPPHKLVHSFHPVLEAFRHELPSRVQIHLLGHQGVTRLDLQHDQFAPHSAVYAACSQGWPLILSSLKTLLETGQPLPVWPGSASIG